MENKKIAIELTTLELMEVVRCIRTAEDSYNSKYTALAKSAQELADKLAVIINNNQLKTEVK